jgi:DNA-binding response OmpR family regulator
MSIHDTPSPKERVAHLRHELRTPINAVLGYGEMLLEDAGADSPPGFHAGLEQMLGLGKHVLDQINRLLGKEAVTEAPNLGELAAQICHCLREPASRIVSFATALAAQAAAHDLGGFWDDLGRVRAAGQRLLALVEEGFGAPMSPKEMPVPKPAPAPAVVESAPVPPPEEVEAWEGGGHVLVVEDNPLNREVLARTLYRQKHHFALAADGIEALEMLDEARFDLVLLDVMMPRMNGFEVLKRLKADPRLRELPVIMISALDDIEGVVRCIEMGAEDYLPKPFDPVLLRARVGACLEKKRLRDLELEYLRNVARVTDAAAALEKGAFDPAALDEVAARPDHLGQLARMFRRMAREVQAREANLRKEVQALRIQIDETRKTKQVADITESAYFQQLQRKAQMMKERGARKRGQS